MSNWVCSNCQSPQPLVEGRTRTMIESLGLTGWVFGVPGVRLTGYVCANDDCKSLTLDLTVGAMEGTLNGPRIDPQKVIFKRRVIPDAVGRPQPKCIPDVLIEDYMEACAIAELSPKASATLARRCIQGIIRDYCGITKGRLVDEIQALRAAVEAGSAAQGVTLELVDALDAVRSIGNIGAHMEKDINLIVSVDPGEAMSLIALIEMLFEELYVAREKRQARLAEVRRIAAEKAVAKNPSPPTKA